MNRILGMVAAGFVSLGLASAGSAQDYVNAFGGYPTPYGAPAPSAPYGLTTGYGYTGNYASRVYTPSSAFGLGYAPGAYSSYYSAPGYSSARYGVTTYASPVYGYSTYTSPVYRYRRGIFGWRARAW